MNHKTNYVDKSRHRLSSNDVVKPTEEIKHERGYSDLSLLSPKHTVPYIILNNTCEMVIQKTLGAP